MNKEKENIATVTITPFNRENWLEALIENSPILIIRNLGDATITYVNDAICKTFNVSKESIIGQKWLIDLKESEKKIIIDGLNIAKSTLVPFKNTVTYKLKDGTEKIIEWNTSPIFDAKGNFTEEFQGLGFDITEKTFIEKELHQKESQLEIFFKQSLDGFFFLQTDKLINLSELQDKSSFRSLFENLRIAKVNSALLNQYNLKEEEVIGTSPKNFFSHNVHHGLRLLRKIIEKQNITFISEQRKFDGTPMWVQGNYFLILDDLQNVTGLFGIQREITESQNLLKEIQASEESYRKLFNSITDSIYIQDENGVFIDVNSGVEKMYGYSRDEFIGKTPEFLSAPGKNDFSKIVSLLNNTYSGKGPATFEFWGLKKNGECFPKEVSISKGVYFGKDVIIAIARDISERKMSEQIILEGEERFRNLYKNSPIGIYRTSADGKVILANPAFIKMLGYSSENELSSINIDQTFYSLKSPRSEFIQKIKTDGKIIGHESIWKRKDGTEVYVRESARPIYNNGELVYFEGTVEDITEKFRAEEALRKSEEKLRETNLTKDKFFSIIAHDLRSPFQGLLGIASILTEEDDLSVDERLEYEKKLYEGLKTQFDLLDDLLTWSRVQRGIIEFNPSINNLLRDTEEVLYFLKGTIEKKNIIINLQIPPNIFIRYDKNMIATVIRNLISNAIKFTDTYGSIIITAEQKAKEVLFSVKDSGIGISEEDQKKLFRIDTQFIRRGTLDEGGTGLGLVLCKEFIEKHGGNISIDSEVNKGSKFIISIPITE